MFNVLVLRLSGIFSPLPGAAAAALAMRGCGLHGVIGCLAEDEGSSPSAGVLVRAQSALMGLNGPHRPHRGSPLHAPCPRAQETRVTSALGPQFSSELCCGCMLSLACYLA